MNVGKAAEAKDTLLPAGVNVVRGDRCKAKRLAEWDDPDKWKILSTGYSLSMEQLRETFGGMDIRAAATPGPWPQLGIQVLATPSPPSLQLLTPTAMAMVGALVPATVAFAMHLPLL